MSEYLSYGEHRHSREGYVEPFGLGSNLFGLNLMVVASWVSEAAAWQPGEPREIDVADVRSLELLLAHERIAPWLQAAPAFWSHDRRSMNTTLAQLRSEMHAQLPFDEQERRWLVGVYEEAPRPVAPPSYELVEEIEARDTEITSSGIRRIVRGRDLVQRWWSWRRDADEYAGSGAALQASLALVRVADLLEPDGFDSVPPSLA